MTRRPHTVLDITLPEPAFGIPSVRERASSGSPPLAALPFDVTAFDTHWKNAQDELELLIQHGLLPDTGTTWHPCHAVLRGVFRDYAAARLSPQAAYQELKGLLPQIPATGPAAILGYDIASAGFIAMHLSVVAGEFALTGGAILRQLLQSAPAT